MKATDFLSLDDLIVGYRAASKAHLLKELCGRAAIKLELKPGPLVEAILKREKLGSTGIGGGVAIPHATCPHLTKPFGIIARLDAPIEFDAVDGNMVDVIFLLFAPPDTGGSQLNALACVARTLRDPKVVAKIRGAPDAHLAYQAIAQAGMHQSQSG